MQKLAVVGIAGAALVAGLALGLRLGAASECPSSPPGAAVAPASPAPPDPSEGGPPSPPSSGAADLPLVLGLAGLPTDREVELVVDRGTWGEEWVSEPLGEDRLVWPAVPTTPAAGSPEAASTTLARARARLTFGPGEGVIARPGCLPSRVPVVVGAADTVLLPYPSCASSAPVLAGVPLLDRDVARLRELGVLGPDAAAPPPEDAPARWLTASELVTTCAWFGGRPADGGAAACAR